MHKDEKPVARMIITVLLVGAPCSICPPADRCRCLQWCNLPLWAKLLGWGLPLLLQQAGDHQAARHTHIPVAGSLVLASRFFGYILLLPMA